MVKKFIEREITVSIFEEGNEFSKELFFKYFYSHLSLPFLKFFLKTSWSPLQITILAILLGFIAAIFFFFADYKYLVVGVVFLNLSLILDKVDGQVARLKNQTSKFGGWLDSLGDIFLIGLYFFTLSIGKYIQDNDPVVLIFGIACLLHILTVFHIIDSKVIYGFKNQKEALYRGNYFGLVNSLHVYLSIGCLLNQVYWMLGVFSVLGVFTWFPSIFKAYKILK